MNWRADRLTDTNERRAVAPVASRRQRAAWRQAVSSTQRPSGTIRPVSSAIGMNDSGATRPRVGCCQRTSASKPTIRVVVEGDDRLVVEAQLAALEGAAQVVLEVDPLASSASFIDGSKTACAASAWDFARTIAISASRSSSSGVARPGRATAMPSDALMNQSRPLSENGARSSAPMPVGDAPRLVGVRDRVEDDPELVAAEPRDRVAGPERR